MKIEIPDASGAFSGVVSSYLSGALPNVEPPVGESLVDTVTNLLVSTGRVRFGPIPRPESLVRIREVIRWAVENGKPLPLVIPWGSRKPMGGNPDLAEVVALLRVKCLVESLQRLMRVEAILRVEDLSGWALWSESSQRIEQSQHYVESFTRLLDVMESPVLLREESILMDREEFMYQEKMLTPIFLEALRQDTSKQRVSEAWKALHHHGWLEPVGEVQYEYMFSRVLKDLSAGGVRPTPSVGDVWKGMAKYFAGVLARRLCGGSGVPEWSSVGAVWVYFGKPTPGVFEDGKVFYRTVDSSECMTHVPPWRARGYLQVSGDETPVVKVRPDGTDVGECEVVHAHLVREDRVVGLDVPVVSV